MKEIHKSKGIEEIIPRDKYKHMTLTKEMIEHHLKDLKFFYNMSEEEANQHYKKGLDPY